MGQIPFVITRPDTNEVMSTGNFDDTLLGGATIPVELIRTDNTDNITGEFFIDPAKVYPVQTASKVLYLQRVNNEYVQFTEVFYAGEFDIECTVQEQIQEGSWCPLFGGASVTNRVLISGISNEIALNIGSSTLVKKHVDIDMTALNTIRLFRDAANDIWVQINGNAPQFLFNLASTFGVKWVGKTNNFECTGYLHGFRIGSNIFNLSEQTGNLLTSTNSLMTATVKSDIAQPHINNNVWAFAPPVTQQIQVINLGVGGNSIQNLIDRFSDVTNVNPDALIIQGGTNDSINPFKIITPELYKTRLTTLVNMALTAGIPADSIFFLSIPPCNDAKQKSDWPTQYIPFYGAYNTFDLNVDVLPLFRTKAQEVCTELEITYIDSLSSITPAMISSDGVHLLTTGYQAEVNLIEPEMTGFQKIACLGDSLTIGVTGTAYPLLLSQILNS